MSAATRARSNASISASINLASATFPEMPVLLRVEKSDVLCFVRVVAISTNRLLLLAAFEEVLTSAAEALVRASGEAFSSAARAGRGYPWVEAASDSVVCVVI